MVIVGEKSLNLLFTKFVKVFAKVDGFERYFVWTFDKKNCIK